MGREGAFFLYQLNVHTFNCRHGADRRVEGGFKEWVVKPRFYKDFVLRWAVCEVWADRWAEGEGKGGV